MTSNKSYSSFDTNDFIDLDTALVDEELRSLNSTPDLNNINTFRFSLRSMDEKEMEHFRRKLVTPLSRYNTPLEYRPISKSPTGSYAESVALFKNLSNNNDHVDLVASDLKDFICDYDDDLGSIIPSSVYYKENQPASTSFLQKLSNHNKHQDSYTANKPRKNSVDATHHEIKTKKSLPTLSRPSYELNKEMEKLTLNKRQNVEPRFNRRESIPQTPTITKRRSLIQAENKRHPENHRLSFQDLEKARRNQIEENEHPVRKQTLSNGSQYPPTLMRKEEPINKYRDSRYEDAKQKHNLTSRQHKQESDLATQRRLRTLSHPHQNGNNNIPRYRRLSNISPKEVRFSSNTLNTEDIVVSRSSGLLSSSTTSSSHSGDLYYDPPSPPDKRKSMPINTALIDEQVRKTENRYSNYLNRIKSEQELSPRRQRVVSEDNESYKFESQRRRSVRIQQQPLSPSQIPVNTAPTLNNRRLYRASSTENVTESARKVLALVQQRRNNTGRTVQLPSNYPKRRDIYYP